MGQSGFIGIGVSKGTPEARALSLALCLGLAGCGSPARQPDVAHLPVGAYHFHAALPAAEPVMSCEDLVTAASPDQAASGPWDAATIERISRSLGYAPR
jgi:hypothetical protein